MTETNSDLHALRFLVRGRVQGVFFRAHTEREATRLGIVGWVRNREDGAVEGEAVGTAAALESFSGFLRRGPSHSRVDELLEEPLPAPPFFERFEIH